MKLFHKKKKDKDESLVLNDYREQFSWSVFWDEQVVGRIKKIKQFLKDHGILFFLLSPFQYKNRLITKLVLIVFGILVGIVPRSISMVNSIKARNAASEIAQAQDSATASIQVHALKSSQYHNQHVLVFEINGDTKNNVSSRTSDYKVTLSVNRGVDDPQHVSYKYKILPVSSSMRLLVVYVDNRKQTDDTGVYNLNIHQTNEAKMDTPIEIVLSKTQKHSKLFGKHGIDLAALSESIVNDSDDSSDKHAIKDAKKDLQKQLRIYRVNEERLNQMGMKIKPTYSDVKKIVDKHLILTYINDNSTVYATVGKTLPTVDDMPDTSASITFRGKTYSTTDTNNADSNDSNNDQTNAARDTELPQVSSYLDSIYGSVSTLNSARQAKFNALSNVEDVLTQYIHPSNMGKRYWVKK